MGGNSAGAEKKNLIKIEIKELTKKNNSNFLVKKELTNIVLYNLFEKRNYNLVKGVLKKKDRDILNISRYQRSMIIGILLSDGWMRNKKGWNSKIGLKQSIKNFDYLWEVFNNLANLCSSYPYLSKNMLRNKLFYSVQFETRQLKCFSEIHSLFFKDENKIKSISVELLDYFDYVVLAHWIMGDGAKRNKGIILCTDSFTIKEIIILINILNIKFNIICTVHLDNGKYRIFINKKELLKIRSKLLPHFSTHFLYKIT